MEKEIKELLEQIMANQVILYKRIEDLEYKIKGSGIRSAPIKTYAEELKIKAEKVLNDIK